VATSGDFYLAIDTPSGRCPRIPCLVVFPGSGLLSLVWLVGIWSIVFGVSSLGLTNRLHGIDAALPKLARHAAAH
jgi:hypothetical protein